MPRQIFSIGDSVRLRWDLAAVRRGTIGIVVQCYHAKLGLYDILFAGAAEPIVVHERYLELIEHMSSVPLS